MPRAKATAPRFHCGVLALLLSASGVPLHAQTIATPTSATTASTSAVTNTTTAGASRGGALLSAMKAAD